VSSQADGDAKRAGRRLTLGAPPVLLLAKAVLYQLSYVGVCARRRTLDRAVTA
jgi:hypothetical protein